MGGVIRKGSFWKDIRDSLYLWAERLPDWTEEWSGTRVVLESERQGGQQLFFSRRCLAGHHPAVAWGGHGVC